MNSKKELLKKSSLYLVLDRNCGRPGALTTALRRLPLEEIDMLQLRDKCAPKERIVEEARIIRKWLRGTRIPFIINDYVDVAKITRSDGVHLGQRDMPIAIARSILGDASIIGVSCNNLAEALRAEKEGADYLGIGPAFTTPTKPDAVKTIPAVLIKKLQSILRIPFFVIGGITAATIQNIRNAGAERIAVCRGILACRDPRSSARTLRAHLTTR